MSKFNTYYLVQLIYNSTPIESELFTDHQQWSDAIVSKIQSLNYRSKRSNESVQDYYTSYLSDKFRFEDNLKISWTKFDESDIS